MNNKIITIALLFSLIPFIGYSQEVDIDDYNFHSREEKNDNSDWFGKWKGIKVWYSKGLNIYDFSSLQGSLSTDSPLLENNIQSEGGGGVLWVKGWAIGGEGSSFNSKVMSSASTNISITGNSSGFMLGHSIIKGKKWALFMLTRFGKTNMTISFYDNNQANFDTSNNYSYNRLGISSSQIHISPEINFDYMLMGKRGLGMSLFLKAGYAYHLSNEDWLSNSLAVINPPSVSFTNTYFKAGVMLGGVR